MIDHLSSTLETLIINHSPLDAHKDNRPALVFQPTLSKTFSSLRQLIIGNIYLTSANVTVLEDLLQMVQEGKRFPVRKIELCRIYLDGAESFQKLLEVLWNTETPRNVDISLNVDIRNLGEAADLTKR